MPERNATLIGNVGSGKSTLLAEIGRALPVTTIAADELYKTNPFFQGEKFGDPNRWALTSNIWFLVHKMELFDDLAEKLETSPVVIDSGLVMSYVYAHFCRLMGFYTDEEFLVFKELYERMVSRLPQPDAIVRLTAPVQVLQERVRHRGRKYEIETYTEEYLTQLEQSLNLAEADLDRQGIRVVNISSQNLDFSDVSKSWALPFIKELNL